MVKTLSCKIPDDIYNFIDSLGESHSDILRPLIMDFVKSFSNAAKKSGIPRVYQQTMANEIDNIHACVDALESVKIKNDVKNR